MAQPGTLDIQTFLNERPFSPLQWTIFGLCFCVVLLDGFDTGAIAFIAPSLLSEWSIERSALGPVLSAALFGLAFGAVAAGPLADRFGRRTVLIVSVLLFGATCLASSASTSLSQLVVLRAITGLGLGAAMPNAVTMMSEYCPDHRRATLTNTMFCGFPVGAALGGFLAAWMIPHWGWRSVLILGGVSPFLLAVLLLVQVPESIRYMVAERYPAERIRSVLRRLSATVPEASNFTMHERATAAVDGKSGIGVVLSRAFVIGSVMLWLAYFMGLVIIYGLLNWMPILLRDAGLSPGTASVVSALFSLGGLGAVLSGRLMDRFNANRVISLCYLLAALAVAAIGQLTGYLLLLVPIVIVGGILTNTAQSSLPALAASFYPTQGRATGVAWMLGIGRFGGILGSFLVAQLAGAKLTFSQIFVVVAIPAVVSAVALIIKNYACPQEKKIVSAMTLEAVGH